MPDVVWFGCLFYWYQDLRPDDARYGMDFHRGKLELGGKNEHSPLANMLPFWTARDKVFGLKLSPSELGAVMQEFDKDGDGTVNCAEFLLTFFRIGFEGRNRALHR